MKICSVMRIKTENTTATILNGSGQLVKLNSMPAVIPKMSEIKLRKMSLYTTFNLSSVTCVFEKVCCPILYHARFCWHKKTCKDHPCRFGVMISLHWRRGDINSYVNIAFARDEFNINCLFGEFHDADV